MRIKSVLILSLLTLNASAAEPTAQLSIKKISEYANFKLGEAATARINILLQGWSIANQHQNPQNQDYRLRRAEFKLSGQIANAPKYFLMIDPSRLILTTANKTFTRSTMIQDFGISYAIVPGLEVTAGQFKAPTTAEGLDSSADLPLPERSLVGRTLGDRREMGVKVAYKAALFNVATMVSSGRPVHINGTGMAHDLHSRFELTPMKDMSFGVFVTMGDDFSYSKKGRWGVNARYNVGQAVLRGEYAQAKDGRVQSYGTTTEVGYWITENFEPVARFETFSPSQSFAHAGKAEMLGVNYYLRDHNTKLQVAGAAMQDMAALNGSNAVVRGANNKEVTMVVQTSI